MQTREPEVVDVDAAVERLLSLGVRAADCVVAIGGGSAIDLAKAVAALATNRHGESVKDFLEGVGRGLKIERPPLPMLAMPTTAGTGTEATKNAVISSFDPPFKKSLRSDLMIPKIVLVDPELTVSLPRDTTAHTGMDAITQLIESDISRRQTRMTNLLCGDGLRAAIPAMFELSHDLTNRSAREAMSHAALMSGLALANSGLGFAHGVAAALGVHTKVPHGLACAVMLPVALEINREIAQKDLAARGWFYEFKLHDVEGLPNVERPRTLESGCEFLEAVIRTLNERFGIPKRLSELGVAREQLPAIAKSSRGNSMDGNPRDVSDDELLATLERIW
jgi:alcohol dehydrogenase class IV